MKKADCIYVIEYEVYGEYQHIEHEAFETKDMAQEHLIKLGFVPYEEFEDCYTLNDEKHTAFMVSFKFHKNK